MLATPAGFAKAINVNGLACPAAPNRPSESKGKSPRLSNRGGAPPPEKRTAPAAHRGGDRIGCRAASPVSKYRIGSDEASLPLRWMTDGRHLIVLIYETGDDFEALLADGRTLG